MDWYPWNIKAFRSGTRHLTALQRGLYRDLIDEYMDTREPLPDHEQALANICRIDVETWRANADPILALPPFHRENGKIFHDFCDGVLDDQDKKTRKKSVHGKKAAAKRWERKKKLKMPSVYPVDAEHMPSDAKGQDRTGQDIKEPPTPGKPSIFVIDQHFAPVWNSYPGRGKNGKRGEAFKGRRNTSLEVFREMFTEEMKGKNHDEHKDFIGKLVAAAIGYGRFLDGTGSPGQTFANWIGARGWEDDYNFDAAPDARRNSGYSIDAVAALASADQTGNPEGRSERLAKLGIDMPAKGDKG